MRSLIRLDDWSADDIDQVFALAGADSDGRGPLTSGCAVMSRCAPNGLFRTSVSCSSVRSSGVGVLAARPNETDVGHPAQSAMNAMIGVASSAENSVSRALLNSNWRANGMFTDS